jgi:hypothetical protein
MFSSRLLFGDEHLFGIGLMAALTQYLGQLLIGLGVERFRRLSFQPAKSGWIHWVTCDGGVDKPVQQEVAARGPAVVIIYQSTAPCTRQAHRSLCLKAFAQEHVAAHGTPLGRQCNFI